MDFSHCSVSDISAIVSPPLRFKSTPISKSFFFTTKSSPASWPITLSNHKIILPIVLATSGGDHGPIPPTSGGGGGGGSNNGKDDKDDEGSESGDEEEEIAQKGEEITANKNKEEAMNALAEEGRTLESLPEDLALAMEEGRMPGSVVKKFFELESSGWLFKWLMQFGGFRERLLADDLFLAKLVMECGVGIFTKAAAEYERRREHFFKELDFVIADVVMAIIADFMLVYLPAPTISLRPALTVNAGALSKFFHNCPENAFQKALAGNSYTLIERMGAVVRNGAKLFAVGTTSSLVGTSVTNILIKARKSMESSGEEEAGENLPIVATSMAYGLYMSVSSNLRYQMLAGVIEQRMLEPIFHKQKVLLSALCFAVRTGNTFLGSLLWVDYARWIGVQKSQD